jgi:glycosyltransferase involved in cell wall biosynthesis
MKICFISAYSSTNQSGATISMIELADELAKLGNDVLVVVPTTANLEQHFIYDPHKPRYIKAKYYSMRMLIGRITLVTWAKYFVKYVLNCVYSRKLARILGSEQIDVIHINGIDSDVGARVAKSIRVPYVWHIRSFLDDDLGMRLFWQNHILRQMEGASKILAISSAIKRRFEDELNCPIEVVYNGVNIEHYSTGQAVTDRSAIELLLPGRIAPQKGQIMAVEAIAMLVHSGLKDIHLTLVGKSELPEYEINIRDLIMREELQEYVQLLDHREDLRQLRATHQIALVCSAHEAFGRVTIEAMLAHELVIGANSDGTAEILESGRYGLLFDPLNTQDLAKQIEYAISHKDEMKVIAEAGYNVAVNRYSIQRVARDVMSIYIDVTS